MPGVSEVRLPGSAIELLCSEFLEEFRQHLLALFLENPSHHFDSMVQAGVAREVEHRSTGAGLGISGAEHECGNPRQQDGAKTHRAGLKGDEQRRIDQSPLTERPGSFANHDHFSMGCRVLPGLAMVMGLSEDASLLHEHRADGHLPSSGALHRLIEGQAHEPAVIFTHVAGCNGV